MSDKLAYTLDEAAAVYPVSRDTLKRAVHTTDQGSFPPPLRAKRMGSGPNAKYIVWAEDLRAWHDLLPDA